MKNIYICERTSHLLRLTPQLLRCVSSPYVLHLTSYVLPLHKQQDRITAVLKLVVAGIY